MPLKRTYFLIILVLLSFSSFAQSKIAKMDTSMIVYPTQELVNKQRFISEFLQFYHYRKAKVNDSLSSVILDDYIKELDYKRVYFLQSDIDRFENYRYRFDDDIKQGNLFAAFHIFNVFKKNFIDRNKLVFQLIQDNETYDFSLDEYYESDRDATPWCESIKEQDEVWRKIIKGQALNLHLTGKDREGIEKILRERFERMERILTQNDAEDVFQIFINSFTNQFDPHTTYMSPKTSDNFKISLSQSLEGIGARLQMENEYTLVFEVLPGGPAFKGGELEAGDKIMGVAQDEDGEMLDIIGWRLDNVVEKIRGPKGSTVRLQVIKHDAGINELPVEIRIVRDKIKLEERRASKEIIDISIKDKKHTFAIIDLPAFYLDFDARQHGDKDYVSTTRDIKKLLEEIDSIGVDAVIIDLRNNGGGSLDEAISMTGLFIKDGPVVQVRSQNGNISIKHDPDKNIVYDGPLAVMVNRYSASASEIFAGAIQDYKRGIIIGEQSFGKGTVQNLFPLGMIMRTEDPKQGQVKATIAKFYRVTGGSTQHMGVIPDIILPSAYKADEVGESMISTALPWDKIKSSSFKPMNIVNSEFIDKLNISHTARLNTEEELITLQENIAEIIEIRENTLMSLNEEKRKEEEDIEDIVIEEEDIVTDSTAVNSKIKEEVKEEKKDTYLTESMKIVADFIELL